MDFMRIVDKVVSLMRITNKVGEIRKGQSIAAIGFPIKNKVEVEAVLKKYGVEYYILMSDEERTVFVNGCRGTAF